MLKGRHVLIGVTGGIAAYKTATLVSLLKKQGAEVRVVMTEHACNFVTPLTFETLSGNRAYVDSFDRKFEIEHVALSKWADVFAIAPATANVMAKMAHGIADDLMSTTFLAMTCPVLIAPAMNTNMWQNQATQENLKVLKSRGIRTVGPGSGHLACGDDGSGRMSEPEEILAAIDRILSPVRDFEGVNVLVTAGPTVERLDPVRFITNRSTGKMGYAIAEAARDRGANVTLVSGPVALSDVPGVKMVRVESSKNLCDAVLEIGAASDVVIQAAAPADFTPAVVAAQKIKKTGDDMTLRLVSTTDIAKTLGERKRPGQVLVAFAAETNDMVENARGKLLKKNADIVVANDVTQPGAGFGVSTNIATIVTKYGARELPKMSKYELGGAILDAVSAIRKEN